MVLHLFTTYTIFTFIFAVNLFGEDLIKLKEISAGLSNPVQITHAVDGSNRLFVAEKTGRIIIIKNNAVLQTPFVDIESRVFTEFESGLLSIAFHPEYKNNNRFYLSYTAKAGEGIKTIIAEYSASKDDPDIARFEENIILTVKEHTYVHHGGQLQFGPDGYLYVSVGDGGWGGDEAQDIDSFFGAVLRIDVNGESPFSIPVDNPFVNSDGADEIWAYGFRNPWRFSFDRLTGRLFLGDVGQVCFEEINLVEKAGNYGWNILEAEHCFSNNTQNDCFKGLVDCDPKGLILPITYYFRNEGGTVIGGYVYRGSDILDLFGKYLFGDFQSSRIWSLEETVFGVWKRTKLISSGLKISSFGEDEQGEIYVSDHDAGAIYKIVPAIKRSIPGPPAKTFVINCENEFNKGAASLERLVMELGMNKTCILELTHLGFGVPVEISTNLKAGTRSSIVVEPTTSMTDHNGEIEFTITAINTGIDWVAWAVKDEKGEFEFSKKAYDRGLAWGMFVKVKN